MTSATRSVFVSVIAPSVQKDSKGLALMKNKTKHLFDLHIRHLVTSINLPLLGNISKLCACVYLSLQGYLENSLGRVSLWVKISGVSDS